MTFFLVLRLFFLLHFRVYDFVEAVALRSIVLRYAGTPIATCVSVFLFPFCLFGDVAFSGYYFVPFPLFSLHGKYVLYVLSFQMVFLYFVTTGWIFDISLCDNSINQSINLSVGSVGAFFSSSCWHYVRLISDVLYRLLFSDIYCCLVKSMGGYQNI